MFPRLVRFASHVSAVVAITAVMLVASAHTASSDRPFDVVRTYSQSFAQRIVDAFEHAVIDPIAFTLPRSPSGSSAATFDDAYNELEMVPPSILRVIVNPDGRATLSGVASPGVEIVIRSQRRAWGRTKVLPTGRWQLRLKDTLDQGVHRMWSVAHIPSNGHQQPGQDVRIALPQTLLAPLIVLNEPGGVQALPAVHSVDAPSSRQAQPGLHLVQNGTSDDATRDRQVRAPQPDTGRGLTGLAFDWLQRSAIAYDRWIVDDLSGGEQGFKFVFRGPDRDLDNEFEDQRERRFADGDYATGLSERWQSLRVGVVEWLRQAQLSYRENVVDALSTGERVSRDRFARAEPDPVQPPRQPERRERAPDTVEDWTLPETDSSPSAETPPQNHDPVSEWPVVRDENFVPPQLPDVTPDPEKEALIRRAEEDAEKARALARKAADQAEATRKATQALLAEEKRLESEWAARRAAAQQAASEAELKQRADEAEKRAAAAEARATEVERLAKEEAVREEQRARDAAQRKTAEDLAAAASAAADREFAAGRVREPPVASDTDPKVADTRPASRPKPAQEFTVADTGATPRRLSMKDNANDAVIEEGSTLGDVDDFDPSVRYVYDMGDGVRPKAKRKAKRVYQKRRVKTRKAKRKSRYRKKARKRRASRRHASRVRGYRKRRARVRRAHRRIYRRVRRCGRLYKFKARRRTHYRRRAYARPIFIPRLRWRRW